MKSFDPTQFTTTKPKPLPVILLLDVSGSMTGTKIDALNAAVREMLEAFKKEIERENQIVVSAVTFGGSSQIHLHLTPAAKVQWKDLLADGGTPLGSALSIAKSIVEDKSIIPSRSYRPAVILVSDGQPTDEWIGALDDFVNRGRSAKCDRMAMAIGTDADETVLSSFIAGTPNQLCYAENASQIHEFFNRVTMTTTARSRSRDPNEVPNGSNIKLEGLTENDADSSRGSSGDKEASGYW
jgi:uncharacterized protein YegL